MNLFSITGSIAGIGLYIPFCIQIAQGKVKQNFATFALFAALDAISAGSIICGHGNFLLPLAYMFGAASAALLISRSKHFGWGYFETFMACLVMFCLIVWAKSGSYWATVASTLANVFAAAPLSVEMYKRPEDSPFLIYAGFLFANIFAMIGGKEWSVQERLYPVACIGLSIASLLLIGRKFFRSKPSYEPA